MEPGTGTNSNNNAISTDAVPGTNTNEDVRALTEQTVAATPENTGLQDEASIVSTLLHAIVGGPSPENQTDDWSTESFTWPERADMHEMENRGEGT